ncbi:MULTISPECIES: HDOD domain-containing protein [Neptunomonas]|uniref:HDOD domain-containing protein n=1 Tax=Neptunomonas marina TaxID=1815562 RepID=A0A437QDJ9_9GAMM|nr:MULTISPECIES: HDOD domain-containing protein [Neptunomonas]RVU32463.1 HDOD domain-containing protein [Neptunomonas marina]
MSKIASLGSRATKMILFDPESAQVNWPQMITRVGKAWEISRIDHVDLLIEQVAHSQVDAVFVCKSLKGLIEIDLFRRLQEISPTTLRFQLGTSIESPRSLAQKLELTHRIFERPDDVSQVVGTVNYLLKISRLTSRSKLRQFLSKENDIASAPKVYHDLNIELNAEATHASRIAAIIEQDPALTAKIIKVANSPFFGLPRPISQIPEAISIIGIRKLRALVVSSYIYGHFPPHPKWGHFSFEDMNARAILVARLAMDIAKEARAPKIIAEQAYLAGLLHNIGIIIMASQAPGLYQKALQLAAHENMPLHAAERKVAGFYHGEIGATLMAMWNIPPRAVEAILLHSIPKLSEERGFQPLTAVHVADALIPAKMGNTNLPINSQLSEAYLEQAGVRQDLHRWRLMAADYRQKIHTATSDQTNR